MPRRNSASAAGEPVVHSGCSRARSAAQAAMPAAATTSTAVAAMTSGLRIGRNLLAAAYRQQRDVVVGVLAAGEGGELGEDRIHRAIGVGGRGGERRGEPLGAEEIAGRRARVEHAV